MIIMAGTDMGTVIISGPAAAVVAAMAAAAAGEAEE